jgi:transcriptional regulator NrdR family protein
MNCPWCGKETKVLDTDKYPCTVVRIRKCIACGAAITTDETIRSPQQDALSREIHKITPATPIASISNNYFPI